VTLGDRVNRRIDADEHDIELIAQQVRKRLVQTLFPSVIEPARRIKHRIDEGLGVRNELLAQGFIRKKRDRRAHEIHSMQPDARLESRSLLIEMQLESPVMDDFAWHAMTLA
jgi:hypothetical protein